ncbi:MAG: hypothetical protein JSR78_07590 [Proteobacteria bacterium]|nr:hypothetical protein [Pseudomonadota bacterium]
MSNKLSNSNESETERRSDKGFVAMRKLSAVRGILNSTQYSQTQKLILISIVSLSDDDFRHAFPTMKTLERYAGVKEERVRIAMRGLDDPEDKNRIVETHRRGRSKSNSYHLITPRLAQLIEAAREDAVRARAIRAANTPTDDISKNEESTDSCAQFEPTENRVSSVDDPTQNEGSIQNEPSKCVDSSGALDVVDPSENEVSRSNDPPESGASMFNDPSENEGLLSLESKYINHRGSLNRQTASDDSRARETVVVKSAGPSTNFDLEGKRAALLEVAAPVIGEVARETTLKDMTVVKLWLENGADFELDVIPAVRKAAFKGAAKGTKIHFWKWFHNAVIEFAAARRRATNDLIGAMAALAEVTAASNSTSAAGVPATPEQLAEKAPRTSASGNLILDMGIGKLSAAGELLDDLLKRYTLRGVIEFACDTVYGEIASKRSRGISMSEAEIIARIRQECANRDKAKVWGKKKTPDFSDILTPERLSGAVERFFGRKSTETVGDN